ncbi:acetate--CoA ligase family protein [Namhaeicola litoreus]|uniref:Acetate--CoA ligase family protein n=1 Tax=Namhaeicola litoreus TaxID=1052145 RepID=A0ABW3XZ77_9FLAO
MIHHKILNPKSIVVIGGSENLENPGGRVLYNLLEHQYKGKLYVVNPKGGEIQGQKTFLRAEELPQVDLAIIAIPAAQVPEVMQILTEDKNTKGFIIFSAGFAEKDQKGAELEQEIKELVEKAGATLLGPNNIGLINRKYAGVFTQPVPKFDPDGVEFLSASGATAVFVMETALAMGLTFSNVYTFGNSAQTCIEDMLEYLDEHYIAGESAKVKLLYIESFKDPARFLKHASSLIRKGCKLAAIKAGRTEAGSRAASSHTGAMASPDVFTEALFEKAGIIRCFGRTELVTVAGILLQKESKGKNLAIITHAGGPGVMLTDVLSKKGLQVPQIKRKDSQNLLSELYDGASANNPIDLLATGTADQLGKVIDYCENNLSEIDAMAVIFGSPGLKKVAEVYQLLSDKIHRCSKPIYAILPSVLNAKEEISAFLSMGNIAFFDEVLFGEALAKVYHQKRVCRTEKHSFEIDTTPIKELISHCQNGYLSPEKAMDVLRWAGIAVVQTYLIKEEKNLLKMTDTLPFPVAQKVIGPTHKSDLGGVKLNVSNKKDFLNNFRELMAIPGAQGVLVQPMIKGHEIFIGAKREGNFPPIVLFGSGGIYVEVLKDLRSAMNPVSTSEAFELISQLHSYPLLKGIRGQKGIHLTLFAEYISRVSALMDGVPEIKELDINPCMAFEKELLAVDVRIRIEK